MRGRYLPSRSRDRRDRIVLHHLAIAALISLGASACGGHQRPTAPSPDLAARPPADSTQRFWPGEDADGAALTLGLVPLRHAPALKGVQEIRIWIGGGIGAESDLLRLVRRNGNTVGTWARYWKLGAVVTKRDTASVTIDSLIRYGLAGQCGPFTRSNGIEACPLKRVPAPDWRATWDSLTQLGVWTLPDESALPRDRIMVADGWLMTVELRDGEYYRAYMYNNPDAHRRAEHKAAAAIGKLANSFWDGLAPASNYHMYRGRLDVGRPLSEMTECGSNKRWQLQWITSPQIDSIRKLIPRTDTVSRHTVYAEIRGLRALPPMVPSGFDEMLEVPELKVLKPWDPARCRE